MNQFPKVSLLCSLLMSISCSDPNPWVISENEEGLLVAEGTDSVLFYQQAVNSLDGEYPRANYIHPLYDLSGNVITEDFPRDHYHHRGVFWTWHQIFIGEQRIGDGWVSDHIQWKAEDVLVDTYTDSCIVRTHVFWESPNWLDSSSNQIPFVEERAKIVVHQQKEHHRIIDFEIQIESLVDSLFLGGSEDPKGYGGFSYRIRLPEDVRFTAASGAVTPQNLAMDLGDWVTIQGDLAGKGIREGVAVVSHPSNPDHPQTWILRAKNSMQNVVYPGRQKVFIAKDQPLVLRYRMVLYQGQLDAAVLEFK